MAREATRQSACRAGNSVLLTGATGFVGMHVLARYLQRTEQHVYALVRGSSAHNAQRRIEQTLNLLFGERHPYGDRVTAVRGELTRPNLGVGDAESCERLAQEVGEIVHAGASVSFGLDLPTSRSINVEGTRRVLELAERCQRRGGLRRLSYVSTAYVSGEHDGRFSEDQLDVGQTFRNSYEQSKFEAELLVQDRRATLPVTVLRPSIVVGESASGWTTSFNVLYWPMRAFARGAYAALPARREAPVDVVPVDYVAEAIVELTGAREAEGATFHLTAGASTSSVGEIVDLTTAFFDRPAPRLLDPSLYRRVVHPLLLRLSQDERRLRALRRSEAFFPYFAGNTTFDERRARVALRRSRLSPPPLPAYFKRLVEFAVAADWGRRQLPRPRQ
ncbi:MAG: SDR family oxidoreductase, partial [Solirubrobacteraceae bacterium]